MKTTFHREFDGSIDQIDPDVLLARRGIPERMYIGIRDHVQILRTQVIPLLRPHPEASRDFFRVHACHGAKRMAGFVQSERLEQTYELFFEGDHIRLARILGAARYGITNGRHRIRIARDMGWAAVPARAMA